MFYTYDQNNSGGGFMSNDSVTFTVIIEASSADEANDRAEEIGIYFDDDYEMDCPCCGPRWSRAWESDGAETPTIYGKPVAEYEEMWAEYEEMWAEPGKPYAYVYYANGEKVAYFSKERTD